MHAGNAKIKKENRRLICTISHTRNMQNLLRGVPEFYSILLFESMNKAGKARKRNIEERSCNQCCSGKAIIITHSDCVFVALVIQHAMRVRHIVWSLFDCKIFFRICLINGKIKKKFIEYNRCVLNFSTTLVFMWGLGWRSGGVTGDFFSVAPPDSAPENEYQGFILG